MTQITILGGSGFLGSALSDLVSKKKINKIIVFDTNKKTKLLPNQKFVKDFARVWSKVMNLDRFDKKIN